MQLYIAAAYAARDYIRELVVPEIPDRHTVVASWLDARHEITPETLGPALGHDDAYINRHTDEDFAEVRAADAVLLLTERYMRGLHPFLDTMAPELFTTGGRHVETGYALALGRVVITVGHPENVFHRGHTTIVPTLSAAITALDDAEAVQQILLG